MGGRHSDSGGQPAQLHPGLSLGLGQNCVLGPAYREAASGPALLQRPALGWTPASLVLRPGPCLRSPWSQRSGLPQHQPCQWPSRTHVLADPGALWSVGLVHT